MVLSFIEDASLAQHGGDEGVLNAGPCGDLGWRPHHHVFGGKRHPRARADSAAPADVGADPSPRRSGDRDRCQAVRDRVHASRTARCVQGSRRGGFAAILAEDDVVACFLSSDAVWEQRCQLWVSRRPLPQGARRENSRCICHAQGGSPPAEIRALTHFTDRVITRVAWSVSGDGQKFLMVENVESADKPVSHFGSNTGSTNSSAPRQ